MRFIKKVRRKQAALYTRTERLSHINTKRLSGGLGQVYRNQYGQDGHVGFGSGLGAGGQLIGQLRPTGDTATNHSADSCEKRARDVVSRFTQSNCSLKGSILDISCGFVGYRPGHCEVAGGHEVGKSDEVGSMGDQGGLRLEPTANMSWLLEAAPCGAGFIVSDCC